MGNRNHEKSWEKEQVLPEMVIYPKQNVPVLPLPSPTPHHSGTLCYVGPSPHKDFPNLAQKALLTSGISSWGHHLT